MKSIICFAVMCLLCVSIRTFASEVIIVDKKDVKVELKSMGTKEINYQVGDVKLTIRVPTIANIRLAEDGNTMILKTVTGKELKGRSDSKLEGTWELGKYQVYISDIKSVVFGRAADPQQVRTMVKQPDGFFARVTDRTGVTMEVANLHLSFLYSCPHPTKWMMTHCEADPRMFFLFEFEEVIVGIPFANIDKIKFTGNEKGVIITGRDGSTLAGNLGEYPAMIGDNSEQTFTGKTEYGDFFLSVEKVRHVVFDHERDKNAPKVDASKDIEGELASEYAIVITTWRGNQVILQDGYVFSLENGYRWRDLKTAFEIQIGESSNVVGFNKIRSIQFKEKGDRKAKMTTISGNTLDVSVSGHWLGGNVGKLGPGRISIDKVAAFEIVTE